MRKKTSVKKIIIWKRNTSNLFLNPEKKISKINKVVRGGKERDGIERENGKTPLSHIGYFMVGRVYPHLVHGPYSSKKLSAYVICQRGDVVDLGEEILCPLCDMSSVAQHSMPCLEPGMHTLLHKFGLKKISHIIF